MGLRIKIILICFLAGFTANAGPGSECLKDLQEVLDKMNSARSVPGNTCFFEYRVKSKPAEGQGPEATSTVKMYADKEHSEILSEQMEVYQDLQNSFTVIPSRKIIYWGDSQMKQADTSGRNDFIKLQSKVLELCTVKSCKEVRGEAGYDKEIVLEVKPDEAKKFEFRTIRFYINTKSKTLHRTVFRYKPGSKLEYVELTYLQTDYNYRKAVFGKTFKSKFLKPDGGLSDTYKGYQLVDIRKRNK